MIVVSSAYTFMDIDAYGGCVAYAELLRAQGKDAIAASTAGLNESVTKTIRDWNAATVRDYKPAANDEFVVVDLSEPAFFDRFITEDKVIEVIDHHMEREQYWRARIGDAAHIEFVGAACTLVYERWQRAGLLRQLSETSARLLICGILDNTLNFRAQITTDRDHLAYKALLEIASLPEDWPARYFGECQQAIVDDVETAIQSDNKKVTYPSLSHTITAGQLVVWDAKQLLDQQLPSIEAIMQKLGEPWFMNVVSIEEGKSYVLATDSSVQQFMSALLGVQFEGSLAEADRLWLRKEIMKADIDRARP